MVIGAFSCLGSLVGVKPPSAVRMMSPIRMTWASAAPPTANTISATIATTMNLLRFKKPTSLSLDAIKRIPSASFAPLRGGSGT